eukprot:CAMPEP_0172416786 /NCGR_PEP_ID=MMETSP1064-20121228/3280_1 /TAXON_ID=202472 /ORGANISM="Aulacoseira subarctica , Strain CCAP 1002/5" /LENGTH=432 /DNA_ID=CAMNT_0013154681 /DNA_START=47 /DNA_END=1342 /DNA_ORIENTATION=+
MSNNNNSSAAVLPIDMEDSHASSLPVDSEAIGRRILRELEEASFIGAPSKVNPQFNEFIWVRNQIAIANNKPVYGAWDMIGRPSTMSTESYLSIPQTSIFQDKIKNSDSAFNLNLNAPVRLDHLVAHIVASIKVYGEGDGSFTKRYETAAEIFNELLISQHFMVGIKSASFVLTKPGVRVKPIAMKGLKDWVEKLLSDNNSEDCFVDRAYQGDGEGDSDAAGIGVSTHTLSDGSQATADALFKKNLHEIKGLRDQGTYLKASNSEGAVEARQRTMHLDNINAAVQAATNPGSTVSYISFTSPLASGGFRASPTNLPDSGVTSVNSSNIEGENVTPKDAPFSTAKASVHAWYASEQNKKLAAENEREALAIQREELQGRQRQQEMMSRNQEMMMNFITDLTKKKQTEVFEEELKGMKRLLDEGFIDEETFNAK